MIQTQLAENYFVIVYKEAKLNTDQTLKCILAKTEKRNKKMAAFFDI